MEQPMNNGFYKLTNFCMIVIPANRDSSLQKNSKKISLKNFPVYNSV